MVLVGALREVDQHRESLLRLERHARLPDGVRVDLCEALENEVAVGTDRLVGEVDPSGRSPRFRLEAAHSVLPRRLEGLEDQRLHPAARHRRIPIDEYGPAAPIRRETAVRDARP